MKNAIILHGAPPKDEYYDPQFPSASNSHWLPWLQKQLLMRDIHAQTPEVSNAYEYDYSQWVKEFERFEITPATLLIGHSTGAGLMIRWLSEHPDARVGRVILVAPYIDAERAVASDFFRFTIDPDLTARTQGLTIFSSDNDMAMVRSSVAVLRTTLKGSAYREFHGYGHFCYEDMKTQAFPELLELALGQKND